MKKSSNYAATTTLAKMLSVNHNRPFLDDRGNTCIVNSKGEVQPITNATALLRYDEWKDIDRTVIEVTVDRLCGVADLIGAGLVHNLGSIGNTISLWQRQSDTTAAQVNMSGIARGEKDTVEFDSKQVPVPVVFKDFEVNIRHLEASRAFGASVDVSMATLAARVVSEKSEDMLFAGNAIQVDGSTIYGYTTHPDRNTVALAMQWTNVAKTGVNILADIQNMLAAARADSMFGPFTLYIPGAYETKLDDDYAPGTSDSRTIRQRILALSGIREIKVADRLANHNVLLVQLTRDVVDMAIAQDISTVQWQQMGGLLEDFKVMAVWVPRVKSTFEGDSGVVHLS